MTRRWKLGIAVTLALCAVGLLTRLCVHMFEERKLVRAVEATRIRAEKGDAKAQFNLASAYFYGKGVPQDHAEAARWYGKSAEQGDPLAESGMGSLYLYGDGVTQDDAEAVRWYRKAAEQGEPTAELGLASAYFYGKGITKDYADAIRWYRTSADHGNAAAQFSLGSIYSQGTGVQQDYAEAITWYRKAASQKDAGAEYALGYLYYNGKGLPRDFDAARRWLQASADHGSTDARLVLSSLEKRSTTTETIDDSGFLIALCAGVFFLVDYLRSGKSLRNSLRSVGFGMVCLCNAGLSLYGITHPGIRYSACRNLFYLAKGVTIGMIVILGLAIMIAPTQNKIELK